MILKIQITEITNEERERLKATKAKDVLILEVECDKNFAECADEGDPDFVEMMLAWLEVSFRKMETGRITREN